METMLLADVLSQYRDGDELSDGWTEEFDWLRQEHPSRLADLRDSISRDGIKFPVLLGTDGRVWDGHHRLCVAVDLALESVPVIHAQDE